MFFGRTRQRIASTHFGSYAGMAAALCMALSAGCAVQPDTSSGEPLADLHRHVEALEQRKSRLEDLNAIKRLQRAYGYYVDNAQWDEVSNLFADDGSVEFALDGVYVGKKRVREYFYALGKDKSGLSPGQLNVHIQLMPVVTLSADGASAKGTWRDVIMAGQLGQRAAWGEGPYENEYVKENGVWKLRKLRWFQTLVVPYEGGWGKHDDVNRGRYVTSLQADAPPTADYLPWPATFVPPFHFRPGTAQEDSAPRTEVAPATAGGARTGSAQSLARRATVLAHEVQLLQAHHEIENLQRIYGYYIDKGMWVHAANLFADDATLAIEGRGEYVGKARVRDYFQAIGEPGPAEGRLFDNMQLQPIVHVAPDGRTAKGRWRLFAQLAQHQQFHEWGLGVYENEYVQENGVWKIRRMHLYPTMYTSYEQGWGKAMQAHSRFEPKLAPDRAAISSSQGFVAPYHYSNPVAGGPVYRDSAAKFAKPLAAADRESLQSLLDTIEHRIARVEDVMDIERLQHIYGYYLATLEWDALADLFVEDGTIEIALRGVYVGKAAVRRNLNLYGQQGLDHGHLHNHMQFQPVIHVADDGKTAKLRSRAFSMMGNAGKTGVWMGGIYENVFVKQDGAWKMKKDQVMNNYFAPYETGWKDLALRPAPGITPSNPPDRPPSFHFDLYPKNFLPPYHYDNPVTGKPATVETAQ